MKNTNTEVTTVDTRDWLIEVDVPEELQIGR